MPPAKKNTSDFKMFSFTFFFRFSSIAALFPHLQLFLFFFQLSLFLTFNSLFFLTLCLSFYFPLFSTSHGFSYSTQTYHLACCFWEGFYFHFRESNISQRVICIHPIAITIIQPFNIVIYWSKIIFEKLFVKSSQTTECPWGFFQKSTYCNILRTFFRLQEI